MVDKEQSNTPEPSEHHATDLDRRTALKKIGALAGAAPAVSLLLTPSASRARGRGGSPCEDDRHRNCHGNGHGSGHPGNGHGWGHGWGRGDKDRWGKGWGRDDKDDWRKGWGRGGKDDRDRKSYGREL